MHAAARISNAIRRTGPSLSAVIALLSLTIALTTFAYLVRVANNIALADHWTWITGLLIPYVEGRIGLGQYLLGQYTFLAHSHFAALAFLLIAYKYFALNLYLQLVWGVVSYVAGALLIARQFWLYRADGANFNAAVLIGTIGYFCITSDFPWFLVVFEYFYFALALILLVAFDRAVQQRISWLAFLVLFVLVLILGDSIGLAASITVLCAAGLLTLSGTLRWQQFVQLLVTISVVLAPMRLVLGPGIPGSETARGAALAALVASPDIIVRAVLSSMSQPLIDNTVLRYYSAQPHLLRYGVGAAVAFGLCSVLWLYWKQNAYRRTILPVLFMAFSFLAALAILTSRYFDGGEDVLLAQRFTRLFTLYVVGFALAAALIEGRAAKAITSTFAVICLAGYVVSASHQWRHIGHVHTYFHRAEQLIRNHELGDENLGRHIVHCSRGLCDRAILFMREKRLYLFR
ncbi:MAG TPA: hypothetical protein VNK91_15275 [Burkholderiaceae bacterium]|nr:hypothetical protein [Burkholderiaceae bacterium]